MSNKPKLDQGDVTSAPSEPSPSGVLSAIQSIADLAARIEAAVAQIEAAAAAAARNAAIMAQKEAVMAIRSARDEALQAIASAAPQHSWGADNPAFQTPERLANSDETANTRRGGAAFVP